MEILTREEVHQIIHEEAGEGRRKLVETLREIQAIPTLQVVAVARQDGTNTVHPRWHPTSAVKRRWISWLRLRSRVLAGKLYNLAGVPGIVRDCDYAATAHDVKIQVRARELFTIVTVNGLEIFFHRLTGAIDGVGISPTPEYLPPGEFIREELEARGWNQQDLADILGRTPTVVSQILTGKREINPELAKDLGAAFNVDPQFFMNLETAYRLFLAEQADSAVARRSKLYSTCPDQGDDKAVEGEKQCSPK